jgi:hypothetical protein
VNSQSAIQAANYALRRKFSAFWLNKRLASLERRFDFQFWSECRLAIRVIHFLAAFSGNRTQSSVSNIRTVNNDPFPSNACQKASEMLLTSLASLIAHVDYAGNTLAV